MLARLAMRLATDEIDFRKSSVLQGVMFENIDSDYADLMHTQNYHPYSQYFIKRENEQNFWVVNALNNDAYKHIIQPLAAKKFCSFYVKKRNITVPIIEKKEVNIEERELLDEFYNKKAERFINLKFITPTAFKKDGSYYILPSSRLIFNSLMGKYGSASSELNMIDEETLNELASHTIVTSHRIKSVYFPMESIKISGFVGNVTLKISGNETMIRYARMLCRFGEFSGVGIKTAMGMGAIKIIEKGYN